MYETTYYEVNTLRSPQTSRTLSGDHENRVTDTGGVLVVKLEERDGDRRILHGNVET